MERLRLTASEREAMMRLQVAVDILLSAPEMLARRIKLVKYGKRDCAMMAAVTKRLVGQLLETIPPDQLTSMVRNIETASYLVGVKTPGPLTRDEWNYGTWVSYNALTTLVNGCHEACQLCALDAQARRSCKLRKALDSIPNELADRETGDCPYFGGL